MYGGSIFTICVSAKNVVDVWRKGTGKQSNLAECFRPWGKTLFRFISFINLLSNFSAATTLICRNDPLAILHHALRHIEPMHSSGPSLDRRRFRQYCGT